MTVLSLSDNSPNLEYISIEHYSQISANTPFSPDTSGSSYASPGLLIVFATSTSPNNLRMMRCILIM